MPDNRRLGKRHCMFKRALDTQRKMLVPFQSGIIKKM